MNHTRSLTHTSTAARALAAVGIVALALGACTAEGDTPDATAEGDTATAAADTTDDGDGPQDAQTDDAGADDTSVAEADPIPAQAQMAPASTYRSDQLGVDVEFTTPRELFVALNAPGRLGMVGGFDPATGEYPPETGIALGFRRWAGWSTPEEAVDSGPGASLDPYDVDAWIAANDILVLGDEDRQIAGRATRVLDVTVDPDTDVAAASEGQGLCFQGWEPCFYMGDAAPVAEQKSDWISAKRTTRIYLVTIGGSEPLLISVGAPPDHEWFDEVESTVIASLTLGPDAPPLT